MILVPVADDTAKNLIGEGIHTGFRKAVEGPAASKAHRAIMSLDDREWDAVLTFLVEGMRSMGYHVCRDE